MSLSDLLRDYIKLKKDYIASHGHCNECSSSIIPGCKCVRAAEFLIHLENKDNEPE